MSPAATPPEQPAFLVQPTSTSLVMQGYTHKVSGDEGVTMATVEERISGLETRVAVQEVKIEGLATKADLQAMMNDLKGFVLSQLDPVKNDLDAVKADLGSVKGDIAVIKNELTHKADHADVQKAINSMTWRMIGMGGTIIVVLGGLMTLFKFLH